MFLPLRLALRTALAPLAGTLLEGQRLKQAVSTPAEQLLGTLHPAPQCCQTFEVEGCQYKLSQFAEAESSHSAWLICFKQLPGLNNSPG